MLEETNLIYGIPKPKLLITGMVVAIVNQHLLGQDQLNLMTGGHVTKMIGG